MQAQALSNWDDLREEIPLQHGPNVVKVKVGKSKSPQCKIQQVTLQHFNNDLIKIQIAFKDFHPDVNDCKKHFKQNFPEINFDPCPLSLDFYESNQDLASLNNILDGINSFEPILPLSTFIQMKQALGVDLAGYAQQIELLYKDKGASKFAEALALAEHYEKSGLTGLMHGLAELCIAADDWKNLVKVLASYEAEKGSKLQCAYLLFVLLNPWHPHSKLKYF